MSVNIFLAALRSGDSSEKRAKLCGINFHALFFGVQVDDAAESIFVESLVKNAVAGLIEEENLYPISGAVEEDEERAGARILVEALTSHSSQKIELAAKIHGSGRHKNSGFRV